MFLTILVSLTPGKCLAGGTESCHGTWSPVERLLYWPKSEWLTARQSVCSLPSLGTGLCCLFTCLISPTSDSHLFEGMLCACWGALCLKVHSNCLMDALWGCRDVIWGKLRLESEGVNILFGTCYVVDASVPVLFHSLLKFPIRWVLFPFYSCRNWGQKDWRAQIYWEKWRSSTTGMPFLLCPEATLLCWVPILASELFLGRNRWEWHKPESNVDVSRLPKWWTRPNLRLAFFSVRWEMLKIGLRLSQNHL